MATPPRPRKTANIALWVVQALVAALFLFAGTMKFVMPVELMTKGTTFTGGFMHFIGACEMLGGLGLLLPGITGRYRVLTSFAAAGLLIIMVGAVTSTVTTLGPTQAILPAVIGILCAVIAYGRRGDGTAQPAAVG
jgi:hypothetical protein